MMMFSVLFPDSACMVTIMINTHAHTHNYGLGLAHTNTAIKGPYEKWTPTEPLYTERTSDIDPCILLKLY